MQRDDHPFPDAPPRWRDELRETFQLALPLVLANLAQTAIYSTDVVMVGWLGAPQLAASALAVNLYSVLLFTGTGLITAAAPLIAAELGARKHSVREVRRTVRMAIWAAVLFAIPAWLILWHTEAVLLALGQDPQLARHSGEFMRALQWALLPALIIVALRNFVAALGNAGIALAVIVAGIFINAALDWGLIFGHWGLPRLGLVGAGIASSITSYLMMFVLIGIVLIHPKTSRFHVFGRLFKPDWERLATIIRVGVPIAFTLAFEVTVFSAAVYLMGLISETSVAAHAIALQIAAITFMVPLGISQATTIRVGLAFGAKDPSWVSRAGSASLVMAMGFMSVAALAIWLFPRDLASIFLDAAKPENAPVLDLAVKFLFIAAIFQLADGAQVVGAAMLRGLQDTRVPMYYAAFGYWVVGLGGGAALAFWGGWQGVGVWTGLAGGLAAVAVLMLWRWSRRGRLDLIPRRAPVDV
ncbi:MATE family efflux transporter [Sphingomonas alba]|uniref:Multidrug-efflux transporter n=1 Tax=Sphingomonas alba TaxID=2908208 RepID=A0ABT0RKY2_9SPHN|nr:MATE family efflux transporter [Sphingomonas alba]MCL6683303.1 MATE family efflux transporter [Sphingomonas alba]